MTNLRGYTVYGPQTTIDALAPLLTAYDIVAQNIDGVLKFRYRGDTETVTIASEDVLSAHPEGDIVERPFGLVDGADMRFPSEVNVSFVEGNNQYQDGNVRERNLFAPAENVRNIRLPITMEELDARKIAFRELWTAWTNRQTVRLTLPPSFIDLVENDKLIIPYDGKTIRIIIRFIELGRNGVLIIEGVVESAQSRDWSNAKSQGPGTTPYPLPNWVECDWWFIDLAPLGDAHYNTAGFYHAGCSLDPESHFDGIRIHMSEDDTTYYNVDGIESETTIGKLIAPNQKLNTGPWGVWDITNTIDVELFHGELSSKTRLEVLNGANAAIVGREIIAFQNATYLGNRQYRLDTLLRGLRGTEAAIPDHVDNEGFLLLNAGTIKFKEWHLDRRTYYWKGVPIGAEVADVEPIQIQYEGNNMKCFAPTHIHGDVDTAGGLYIRWTRRTRLTHRIFAMAPAPWDEDRSWWDIDIWEDETKTTFLRHVGLTGGLDPFAWYYSVAEQTADGRAVIGDPIYVEIAQVGSRVGKGKVGSGIVP